MSLGLVFLLLTSALIAATPKKDVKKEDSKPKSSEIQQERDTILQLSPNQIWKVWKDVEIPQDEVEAVLNSTSSYEGSDKYKEFLKKDGILVESDVLNPFVGGSAARLQGDFEIALRAYVNKRWSKYDLYKFREGDLGQPHIKKLDRVKDSKHEYYFVYRADIPKYKEAADRNLIFMCEFHSVKKDDKEAMKFISIKDIKQIYKLSDEGRVTVGLDEELTMHKFLEVTPTVWYKPGENNISFFYTSFSSDGNEWLGAIVEVHNRYKEGIIKIKILSRDEADIAFLFDDSEGEAKLHPGNGNERILKYKLGRVGVDPLWNEKTKEIIGFAVIFELVDVKTNSVTGIYGVPYLVDKKNGSVWTFGPRGLNDKGQNLVRIIPEGKGELPTEKQTENN